MIQLPAIVNGAPCIMLTPHSIEEAGRSCKDRFGNRFEGFDAIPTAVKARSKWNSYRAKEISRAELEDWLSQQDDEQEIRALFNAMRG